MMKFSDRAKFLATLNQWVNDGSRIVSFSTNPYGEEVVLKGKDGATEYLIFFYDEEDFAAADYVDGDEEGVSVKQSSKVWQSTLNKNLTSSIERYGYVNVDEFSDEELAEIETIPGLKTHLVPDGNIRVSKLVAPSNVSFGDVWRYHIKDLNANKSKNERVIDEIIENQIHFRTQYANYLMSNPGFLSTFENFIVEFGEMALSTDDAKRLADPNQYNVQFCQNVRFTNNPNG